MDIELRAYQQEAINRIGQAFDKGLKKVLICVPTGGGKTIIFNYFSLSQNLRTLVIAHREELLEQAIDKYVFLGGKHADCGLIKASTWQVRPYTCASIQSLYLYPDRVRELSKEFDLVIVDEAHHVCSPTYKSVLETLESTNPDLKFLGATATPFRNDGQSLECFFQEQVFSISHAYLMAHGYLVPLRGRRIYLPLNLDSLRASEEGDFTDRSLGRLISASPEIYSMIVQKWKEYAQDRRTIFFLPMVQNAKELTEEFIRQGVRAEYVAGNFNPAERKEVLRAFKEGRIRVLCNAMLLTEGFDDPEVDCIGIVRPTQSLVLYAQIIGRGLRIALGKKDCMVLDFTGASKKHSLVGLEHLFGLEDEKVRREIEKILSEGEEVSIGGMVLDEEGTEVWLEVLRGNHTEEFEFENKEVLRYLTWFDNRTAVISCGLSDRVLVLEKENGKARIYLLEAGKEKVLRESLPEDYAYSVFTTLWKRFRDSFMESWADRAINAPATAKQIAYLRIASELGFIDGAVLEKLSKLDASNLISVLKAKEEFRDRIQMLAKERRIRFSIQEPEEKLLEFLREFLSHRVSITEFPEWLLREKGYYGINWEEYHKDLIKLFWQAYFLSWKENKEVEESLRELLEERGYGNVAEPLAINVVWKFNLEDISLEFSKLLSFLCDGDGRYSFFIKASNLLNKFPSLLPFKTILTRCPSLKSLLEDFEKECLQKKPPLREAELTLKHLKELRMAGISKEILFKKLKEAFPNRTITQNVLDWVWKMMKVLA